MDKFQSLIFRFCLFYCPFCSVFFIMREKNLQIANKKPRYSRSVAGVMFVE